VNTFNKSLLNTIFLASFILVVLSSCTIACAQANTISGIIESYNFPAGSFEIVTLYPDALSPGEIISEGHPPSKNITYVAEANGFLSFKIEPTEGRSVYVKINGKDYRGYADEFSRTVKAGETLLITLTPPLRLTNSSWIQTESGEITNIDTYSWNTTAGILSYNLTVAEAPEVEFSWYPAEPSRGDSVRFQAHMDMLMFKSMTWLINGVEIDYARNQTQWEYPDIQEGVYVVILQVEDLYGATAEKSYTLTVGEQRLLHGIIFDDLGNRYEDLTVHLYWNGVYQGTTWTDHDGYYEFSTINNQPITLPLLGEGEIKIEFTDRDHLFELRDLNADRDNPVSVTYPLTSITSEAQLEYHIGFYGDMADDTDTPRVREQYIDDYALIFYYTNIAKKFYEEKLNYFFFNTPVYILIEDTADNEAYFSYTGNPEIEGKTEYPMIYYSSLAAKRTEYEAPINREFHEFSHYVMWDLYGSIPPLHYKLNPSGDYVAIDENHAGFENHCSSDSYVEGFAEFMALLINKEMNVQPPASPLLPDFAWSRYPVGKANEYLEYNIDQPTDEEFCIAGLLWDLYDGVEPVDKDNVDLDLESVWSILSEPYIFPVYYRYNPKTGLTKKLDETTMDIRYISYIKDLYDGLIENAEYYNYSSSQINTLFVSHKIFNDTNKDGVWQPGEPVGINLLNSKDRRKRPIDESQLLALDIPEDMLPIEVKVTSTHTGPYTIYDHEYTVTLWKYPAQIPVMMPPEKYSPSMQIEVVKQGYVDANPLILDPETYGELVSTLGNLGSHTPALDTNVSEYVIISGVDAPKTVEAGEKVTLTVSLEYSFSEITLINIGVYDYGSESYLFEESYWVQGEGAEDYLVQFKAPDREQVLEVEVNVIYQKDDTWYNAPGDQWYSYHTINVVKTGVPGYPIAALIAGVALYLYIRRQNQTRPRNIPPPANPIN